MVETMIETEDRITLQTRPLSPMVGCEVLDFDAARPASDAVIGQLRALLDRTGVLLFRGQTLSPEAHVAFSRRFGALQEVAQKQYQMDGQPLIYIIGNVRDGDRQVGDPSVGRLWHSDQSFLQHPALGSLLYGVECPPEGAETLFANMYLAYDTLPEDLKALAGRLHAIHSFAEYYEELRHRDPTQPPLTDDRRTRYPDVVHPLVRRNPHTGRLALYINPGYATGILEMPGEDGDTLLDRLCAHACSPDLVYAHRWQAGDLLFWDNLGVNHKGTPFDTTRYTRRMHRTTIAGSAETYRATLLPPM